MPPKFGKNNKYKNMQPADFGVILVNKGDVTHVINTNDYGLKITHEHPENKNRSTIKKFKLH